jgi:hypothetical protein
MSAANDTGPVRLHIQWPVGRVLCTMRYVQALDSYAPPRQLWAQCLDGCFWRTARLFTMYGASPANVTWSSITAYLSSALCSTVPAICSYAVFATKASVDAGSRRYKPHVRARSEATGFGTNGDADISKLVVQYKSGCFVIRCAAKDCINLVAASVVQSPSHRLRRQGKNTCWSCSRHKVSFLPHAQICSCAVLIPVFQHHFTFWIGSDRKDGGNFRARRLSVAL